MLTLPLHLNGQPAARRLHLGCGITHLHGWTNADLHPTPATDLTFDCQEPWPLEADSLAVVMASHMLEHLPKPLAFFQHAWEALEDGGLLFLRLPYGGHRSAMGDLDHQRPWYPGSFACVQPGYAEAVRHPGYASWQWPFAVECVDLFLVPRAVKLLRWRLLRWLLLPYVSLIGEAVQELSVRLRALKSDASLAQWRTHGHPANAIPQQYVCYAHEWDGTPPDGPGRALHVVGPVET
jgi:SAM-dependent methyltransferase